MSNTSLVALIGAGAAAYFFWPQIETLLGIPPASAAPTSTPTAPPAMSAAQQTAIANLQLLMAPGIQQAIQFAAGNPAQATPSGWNYWMTKVTGIPSPNLPNVPADPNQQVSWPTYWTALGQWATAAAQSPTGIA